MATERHMAHYLVSAVPKHERLEELGQRLARAEFMSLRPFGPTLTHSLKNARVRRDGVAVWEEEDYCRPPLAEERAAVLDDYFHDLRVLRVEQGEGWSKIEAHPRLFPDLAPL
jgi:hypothetical protein